MSEAEPRFAVLRQSADADAVAAIERLVREASDRELSRVRRIAAHDPHSLPQWEYARQVFWSSSIELPDDTAFEQLLQKTVLEAVELPAGEKAILSLQLPAQFVILFDTVTHAAHFIDVKGEPTRDRQSLSLVFNNVRAPTGTVEMRPGPLRWTWNSACASPASLSSSPTSKARPSSTSGSATSSPTRWCGRTSAY